MRIAHSMQVVQALEQLSEIVSADVCSKRSAFENVLTQLSALDQLHYNVHDWLLMDVLIRGRVLRHQQSTEVVADVLDKVVMLDLLDCVDLFLQLCLQGWIGHHNLGIQNLDCDLCSSGDIGGFLHLAVASLPNGTALKDELFVDNLLHND